jgi:hypothetical protein
MNMQYEELVFQIRGQGQLSGFVGLRFVLVVGHTWSDK